jgi:hypothetical protein
MNGATFVVYVNNAIFHTGAKLPEYITSGRHFELVEICQRFIYIRREVETEPFGICAVNRALYQPWMIAENILHLVQGALTEGTQVLGQILTQP